MKKFYSLLVLLSICGIYNAQNLIPNGDFEQYSTCPTTFAQIDSALYWTYPTAQSSTDYFNTCADVSTLVGVPVNQGTGFQYPHSGSGYGGIFLYYTLQPIFDNVREYMEVPLTSPLLANASYHFEMYVNILNGCGYTTDAIGAYFSDTSLTGINNYNSLPYTPQIVNTPGNIFDTLNWTLVSGNFIADGGEQYLIIGNFNDDVNTPISVFYNFGMTAVYTYIDDVSVTRNESAGIDDPADFNMTNAYPNPFTDQLTITSSKNQSSELVIYDVASRELIRQNFTGSVSINTATLPKGLYFYEVKNENGRIKTGKIVKN